MRLTPLETWLGTTPLFNSLEPELLEELAGICEEKTIGRGELVFSDGDDGDGFYIVRSGKVKVFKVSWEGKEQVLHIFGPGEPFGEVAVFAGDKFPAAAESLENSVLVFIPRKSFLGLLYKHPDLALNLLAILSRRLRRFAALIEDLSLKEVPARLAAYLLYMKAVGGGSNTIELDIPKNLLAGLLGTIPETLSRVLGRMDKKGLITSEGSKIIIRDPEGLQALAEMGGGL